MRLMDKDGAAVQDGQHDLYIYKCEDPSKLENCGYLTLPAFAKDYEGDWHWLNYNFTLIMGCL